ncbi:hypothetical protein B0H65DRAFT_468373 [Neurospora tetraspora]|uniref:Uncharacterized protein n=1 Tax=Neurospora tetraspora TaxID=94610 RepID=A0AAE0JDH0_9PEZI|nr:hypothetical protein B0H65DRAFT_468373 [Neurospora tetraspora]
MVPLSLILLGSLLPFHFSRQDHRMETVFFVWLMVLIPVICYRMYGQFQLLPLVASPFVVMVFYDLGICVIMLCGLLELCCDRVGL